MISVVCVHKDLGWFLNSLLKPPIITTNVTTPSTRWLALLILPTVLQGRDDRDSIHSKIRESEAQRGKDLPRDWDTMIVSLSQKEKRVSKCSAPVLLILPSDLLVPEWTVLQSGMNPGAFRHKVSEDSFSLLLLLNLEKAFRIMPLGNDSLQSFCFRNQVMCSEYVIFPPWYWWQNHTLDQTKGWLGGREKCGLLVSTQQFEPSILGFLSNSLSNKQDA